VIRRATEADLPRIAEIRFSVRENRLSDPSRVPPEMVTWFLDNPGFRVWEEGGRVRGFAAHDPRDGSIWALFVDPEDERRGIGSALLEDELALLREAGAGRIWLTTDPASRAAGFYRRRGFVQEGLTSSGHEEILVLHGSWPDPPCG
jgi:ribosomal protein S18 acetylase RimI-like enzyme